MKSISITLPPASLIALTTATIFCFASAQAPAPKLLNRGVGTFTEKPSLTTEQAVILSHMSLVQVSDGLGGFVDTIQISGVNVQVINGIGATESTNGAGNLIVGYQELGNGVYPDERTGGVTCFAGMNAPDRCIF